MIKYTVMCLYPNLIIMIGAATNASWVVNWILLFAKLYVAIVSNSKSVYAGLADSIVDLISQLVLVIATRHVAVLHEKYPVGRSKLEALSVLACSAIMTVCNIEVIQYASIDLYRGWAKHEYPTLDISNVTLIVLGLGIFLKLVLYIFCKYAMSLSNGSGTDALEALAEDHLNDIFSNMGTVIAVIVTVSSDSLWWIDAMGAIVISLVIAYRWTHLIYEQVSK